MNYLSTKELAMLWGISERRVRNLLDSGRIKGATKVGREWVIPDDAPKPYDKRKKTGIKMEFQIDEKDPVLLETIKLQKELIQNRISYENRYYRIRESVTTEWIYNVNRHFGNSLTLEEVKTVLSGYTVGGKTIREHLEIVNFREAAEYLKEFALSHGTITENEIKRLNYILLKGVEKEGLGYFRLKDLVGQNGELNGISFIAVPSAMADLMNSYIGWKKYDPLIVASVVFGEFLKIKPFEFGNQKMAELYLNGILFANGYYQVIFTDEDEKEVIDALNIARNEKDYRPLIKMVSRKEYETLIRIRDAKWE